jgi:hypothetical protein
MQLSCRIHHTNLTYLHSVICVTVAQNSIRQRFHSIKVKPLANRHKLSRARLQDLLSNNATIECRLSTTMYVRVYRFRTYSQISILFNVCRMFLGHVLALASLPACNLHTIGPKTARAPYENRCNNRCKAWFVSWPISRAPSFSAYATSVKASALLCTAGRPLSSMN